MGAGTWPKLVPSQAAGTVLGTLTLSHHPKCSLLVTPLCPWFQGQSQNCFGREGARDKMSANDRSPFKGVHPLPGDAAAIVLRWDSGSRRAVLSPGLHICPAASLGGCCFACLWELAAGMPGVPTHC